MEGKRFACVLITSVAILGQADTITLDNGSKIVGQITVLKQDTVAIKTDFAGTLNLKRERITTIETDAPRYVALKSGNRLFGTVIHKDGQTVVSTEDGDMTVKENSLVAVWDKTEQDPTVPPPPPPRKWSYELSGDLVGKTGNTEKMRLGGGAKARLKGPEDQLLFYLRGAKAEEEGNRTESEIVGGIDFERIFLGKRHSWYVRTEMEKDEIENVELRTTVAGGYGFYFIRNNKQNLRARSGIQYRNVDYDDGRVGRDSLGLDAGLHHDLAFTPYLKLNNDLTYTPSFDNWSDYRIYHESSLDLPLGTSKFWKIRLGISNEYNSLSAADAEDLDTTYFAKLVLSFQ